MSIDLPSFPTHTERMKSVYDRFREDTADHVMRILHDDGLYRHIVYTRPGSIFDRYELVTVPGLLTMTGDRGDYSFRRLDDMFQFFGSRGPGAFDAHYWAQKCVAGTTYEYSADSFTEDVVERFRDFVDERELGDDTAAELWEEIEDSVLRHAEWEPGAREAVESFEGPHGFAFSDGWEMNFRELDSHFLWACNAIAAGVQRYRRVEGSIV